MAGSQNPEKPARQFESLSIHAGLNRQENEVKDPAIYASTVSVTETPRLRLAPDIIKSFVFKDSAHGAAIFNMTAEAFCYSRIANPTTSVFEARMAALEGGEAALATATGSAALFTAVVTLAQRGSNIVVASSISESSTHTFKCRFPALGITCRNSETEQIVQEIDNKTAFVFVESLPSDKLLISDIESIAAAAHSKGVPLVVDNTAGAGGCLIRPIDHGADIVIQDAAPWLSISGSNSVGIIVDSGKFDWSQCTERYPQFFEPSPGFHGLKIWDKFGKLSFVSYAKAAVMRDSGPCLNPFEAFQLISGLETLSVRLERISSNALALVEWIKERTCEKQFVEVSYPGLSLAAKKYARRGYGGLLSVTFEDPNLFQRLLSKATIVSLGQSIGGSKTIIIPCPSDSAEAKPRAWVSVGLENIDDIIRDFEQALSDPGT